MLQSTSAPTHSSDDDKAKKNLQRRISVGAILASTFLNLLGFTMAGPITPALGKHFRLEVGASFGSLTSAYPFGMLFGLFLWPALSDKRGRKPIIAASLLGSGLGLAAQARVVHSNKPLGYFLLARALTGVFAGSGPVSKAYLADVGYKDGKLPRYLALRDAASTMAFVVGPMLGGILFEIRRRLVGATAAAGMDGSLAFVIGVSAAASLAAALLVAGLVVDVKPKPPSKDAATPDEEEEEDELIVSCPLGVRMWAGVASVCVVSFLFNIGDSAFHAFFPALLRDGAGIGAKDTGLLYTLLACVSFAVSTTSTGWVLGTWGPVAACATGLGLVASGLLALGTAASALWGLQPRFAVLAAAGAIYYCGVPLYGPSIPTMLLRCVPSYRRGAVMGLDGAINTIGRIISPLIMGEIYRRHGAGAAFGAAGLAVFAGAATTLFRRFVVLRDSYRQP